MKLFENIVGQERAKRKMEFLLQGYNATGVMPHLMFIAPKGCGKTTMAKAMARQLESEVNVGKPKPFIEINCSTIKGVKQFFNQIVIPRMMGGQEITLLFDECSELPRELTMALLTILNPNKENKNRFTYEEAEVEFDFSKQTFMFATTEAQSVFHALMDRCERLDLEEYTLDHLAKIISNSLNEISFDKNVLPQISPVLRGNARSAQKMANHIHLFLKCKGQKFFGQTEWDELTEALGILPLGLNSIELQVLKALEGSNGCTLTNIAAKVGLSRSCVQRDFELYLLKLNLIEIGVGGRRLTMRGITYLKAMQPPPVKPLVAEEAPAATWSATTPANTPAPVC